MNAFNSHQFATQELATFTQMLGLSAVTAEAQTSTPPLDVSQNYADVPDVEAITIAAAAAEITGHSVEAPTSAPTTPQGPVV